MSLFFLDDKITLRVVFKYSLLQIPGMMLLGVFLYVLFKFDFVSSGLAAIFMVLWTVKDIVLFPFVWHSYDSAGGGHSNTMTGRRGIARDDFNPGGYVEIAGELWQAEVTEGSLSVKKGDNVEVLGRRGLLLKVKLREK